MSGQPQGGLSLKPLIQDEECFTSLQDLVNIGGKHVRKEPHWLDN